MLCLKCHGNMYVHTHHIIKCHGMSTCTTCDSELSSNMYDCLSHVCKQLYRAFLGTITQDGATILGMMVVVHWPYSCSLHPLTRSILLSLLAYFPHLCYPVQWCLALPTTVPCTLPASLPPTLSWLQPYVHVEAHVQTCVHSGSL